MTRTDGLLLCKDALKAYPKGAVAEVWVRMPIQLGDMIMAMPSLFAIKAKWDALARESGVELRFILTGKAAVNLFQDVAPGLGFEGHPDGEAGFPCTTLALLRRFRQHRPLALIHFSKSDRIKIAAWLARVPVRAGISAGGSNWSFQFSTPFEVPGRIGHKIHLFQALVDWLAGPGTEPQPLPLIPENLGGADGLEILRSHGWDGGPYCVLAPMPHQRAPHRQWFPLDEPWLELCRLMKAEGVTPVFVGGQEHQDYLNQLALRGGALSLAGRTRLSQLTALFSNALGAICVDTGLAHMAGGSGRPTVIIFSTGREGVDIACGPNVVALRGAPAGDYCYPLEPGAFELATDALCRSTARIPAIRAWRVLKAVAAETPGGEG